MGATKIDELDYTTSRIRSSPPVPPFRRTEGSIPRAGGSDHTSVRYTGIASENWTLCIGTESGIFIRWACSPFLGLHGRSHEYGW